MLQLTNHIFGDTGGHGLPLFNALQEIGVNLNTFTIPKNVRIIHCGDLIHKGPDSKALLETVDILIRNNPGQWIQVLGNHEFQHLEGSPYFWRCKCDLNDIHIINEWWDNGLAFSAFGVEQVEDMKLEVSAKPKITIPDKGILFTHGGLTHFWWTILGKPQTAKEAAKLINSLDVDQVTIPGQMLGVNNFRVGPVWAIGNDEVFKSWIHQQDKPADELPFMLIHGHTTSYNFARKVWWNASPSFAKFRQATKLNPAKRAVITELAGSLMVGIDPGFNMKADLETQPYLTLKSAL